MKMSLNQIKWKLILTSIFVLSPVKQLFAQQSPEEKLNMVMYAIMNMYVDSVSKATFVDQQISRMLQEMDPFTMYLPAQQAKAKEQSILAQPSGEQSKRSSVQVVPGNGNKQRTVNSTGKMSSLRYYMLDKTTGYLQLMIFSEVASEEFRIAIAALRSKGMKHLILDLRNNHGGLTDVAVAIADELLDGDKTIFTAEGAHIDRQVFKAGKTGCFEKGQIVLLVNGETMSAAELFAGAIQDWDRGVVVGEKSFGKGLIQETLPFEDGSAIQISVARYLTPAGRSIQKPYNDGVQPNNDPKTCPSLIHRRPLICNDGINPDMEVPSFSTPYETNWYTMFLLTRSASDVANNYLDKNREKLKYKSEESFIKNFDSQQLKELVDRKIQEMKIEISEEDYKKSIDRVLLEVKAYLGRALFNSDDCYYRIIATNTNSAAEHHANLVLRKAWELIKSSI